MHVLDKVVRDTLERSRKVLLRVVRGSPRRPVGTRGDAFMAGADRRYHHEVHGSYEIDVRGGRLEQIVDNPVLVVELAMVAPARVVVETAVCSHPLG